MQFWLRSSHEVAVKVSTWLQSPEAQLGLMNLLLRWLTYLNDKLVLSVGRRPQFSSHMGLSTGLVKCPSQHGGWLLLKQVILETTMEAMTSLGSHTLSLLLSY